VVELEGLAHSAVGGHCGRPPVPVRTPVATVMMVDVVAAAAGDRPERQRLDGDLREPVDQLGRSWKVREQLEVGRGDPRRGTKSPATVVVEVGPPGPPYREILPNSGPSKKRES
jgi:hypothetical protein